MANPEVDNYVKPQVEIERDQWRGLYRKLEKRVDEIDWMLRRSSSIGGYPLAIMGRDAESVLEFSVTPTIRKLLRQRELDPLEIHYLLEMLEKLGWNRDENGGSVAVWLRGFLAGKGVVMPIGDGGGKDEI